jgi:hypothetical protein
MHYFAPSGGTGTDSTKNAMGHVTLNFFFASGGSVGHIVHSIGSGEWNDNSLFFMLGWDWYEFEKKRAGAR